MNIKQENQWKMLQHKIGKLLQGKTKIWFAFTDEYISNLMQQKGQRHKKSRRNQRDRDSQI